MELITPVLRVGPDWPGQGRAIESSVQDFSLTVGEGSFVHMDMVLFTQRSQDTCPAPHLSQGASPELFSLRRTQSSYPLNGSSNRYNFPTLLMRQFFIPTGNCDPIKGSVGSSSLNQA